MLLWLNRIDVERTPWQKEEKLEICLILKFLRGAYSQCRGV